MRFWPQPSQLKMPKYAAASNSGCVSFAALAVRGSAAATNELAAACAKNWRRDWSTARTRVLCCWRAGTRVLCCWRAHSCWRFATHTATRQKWRMAPMHRPLSAPCTVPAQLAGLQSQPWHASSDLGTGFSRLLLPKHCAICSYLCSNSRIRITYNIRSHCQQTDAATYAHSCTLDHLLSIAAQNSSRVIK